MRGKTYLGSVIGMVILLALGTLGARAAVPQMINYQGVLTDPMGNAVPDGDYGMVFSIYDVPAGGSALWTETQTVNVSGGIYNVQLGALSPFKPGLSFNGDLYLAVKVESDLEMSPRLRLTSVGFALKAEDSETLEGKKWTDFASNSHGHAWADISNPPPGLGDGDDVGITVETDPTVAASVKDGVSWGELSGIPAGFADGVDNTGLTVETDPTVAASVKDGVSWGEISGIPSGFADGVDNTGLTAETDPEVGSNTLNYLSKWSGSALVKGTIYDNGKIGIGTASPRTDLEIEGVTGLRVTTGQHSNVFGEFRHGYSDGLIINANAGGGWADIRFQTDTVTRMFIEKGGNVGIGTESPGSTLHVRGAESDGANTGTVEITTGSGAGDTSLFIDSDEIDAGPWLFGYRALKIQSNSPGDVLLANGGGSVGIGTATPIRKLHVDAGSGSEAIYGYGSTGVWGNSPTGGYGVFGQTSVNTSGYGVYSSGNFAASGTKAFQMDHPLDPENKYLNHYCTEGAEPLLIYRGTVILGGDGEAWVELPEYFESINRDYHYQLTCIGKFAPVYVAQEIRENRFKIGGGGPGTKICWTVTGVRNDAYVRAYKAPVEVPKPEHHRGRYLHPELFGRGRDMAIHHEGRAQ